MINVPQKKRALKNTGSYEHVSLKIHNSPFHQSKLAAETGIMAHVIQDFHKKSGILLLSGFNYQSAHPYYLHRTLLSLAKRIGTPCMQHERSWVEKPARF